MKWLLINDESQLNVIDTQSFDSAIHTILIFKHSTRCSISSVALNRLERAWDANNDKIPTYFLDLIQHRSISEKIAQKYAIQHESPQILVIKNGKCIYSASHSSISVSDIQAAILSINS
jgi:bacillithiol system protein YtxJ